MHGYGHGYGWADAAIFCLGEKTEKFAKLRPDTIVSLFEGYHNNNLVVDINEPLEEELKAEQHVTQKIIEDERKMLLQASIVRTTQIRKTLSTKSLPQKSSASRAEVYARRDPYRRMHKRPHRKRVFRKGQRKSEHLALPCLKY
ncbi:hypothetical protein HPB48_015490 [Haemaphysalis longicornis]|uniref:Uncharacterized protein n=1 Tax=Haemaphysalis longicornis TaxID=44386 RepID=A0A9J6FKS2_HAELO|nr:hypothetical protein HPB48_015490 [Haemaphysalis longicornis]